MTHIIASITPRREPATWLQVFMAAVFTWALIWVVGMLLGSQFPIRQDAGWVQHYGTLTGYFTVFIFIMMFSGTVSWGPLLLMMPIVKYIDARNTNGPMVGLALGCGVGVAFAAIFFPFRFSPWGGALGGLMGAVNFLLLRMLRS